VKAAKIWNFRHILKSHLLFYQSDKIEKLNFDKTYNYLVHLVNERNQITACPIGTIYKKETCRNDGSELDFVILILFKEIDFKIF